MKKDTLQRFINKYYLNGINQSAVWAVKNGTLKATVMTSTKTMMADVTWKNFNGFDEVEFGILTTNRLLGLLKTFPFENVSMEIGKRATGDVATVGFSAAKYKMQYVTSNPKLLDPIPSFKNVPPSTAAIIMDEEFVDWFKSANAAVGDCGALFTVIMSQQTGKLEVAIGHKAKGYSDRLSFQPSTVESLDVVKATNYYTAKLLAEVLKANSEFKDPILYLCEAGLASISFFEEDLNSKYYLAKVDVED